MQERETEGREKPKGGETRESLYMNRKSRKTIHVTCESTYVLCVLCKTIKP